MKSLRSLNKYFITYKWRFLLGILFTVISNYFAVKMPKYVQVSIDGLQKTGASTQLNDALWLSFKIGGLYLLLSATKGFFLFLMRQTIIVMSRWIEFDLKQAIYTHYQTLDTDFYKRNRIGDLMNRISEDVGQVRMYLGPGVMYTINLLVLTIFSLYQMAQISGKLTLFALIPLPFMSLIIYKVSNKINKASKSVQEEQSHISTLAQETFSGIRLIKAYSQFGPSSDRMERAANSYREKSMKLVLINALFMPTIMLLIGLSTLLVIYVGGLLTETHQLSLGGIVAFIFYVNNLTWPFVSIGWVTSIIQRAEASQQRINEFLNTKPSIVNPNEEAFDLRGDIEFKHVSFTYSNTGIKALNDVNFVIKSGQHLGILGKTGSGKSSILNLIGRQFDPNEGVIHINQKALNTINLKDYRSQIAVVPQEVFLFSDTIRNNVAFGAHEHVTDEAIINALTRSHVWHNIEEFPDRMDTQLGELGVNLSGGQKQRISIARALIRNPKLLLMDDCLSAVDTETEEIILNELRLLPQAPSIVMVSHRISTLRNCEQIIVLENGEILEMGSPEELMKLKGAYYETYLQQLNEEQA
ncbi:MAG: ABC transporter ATP-binding protein [Flavobacteriales bacterium]